MIQRLPLEIIQKIFEYLDRRKVHQYFYLSRVWYPVLRSIYFKEISWETTYGLQQLKKKLSKIDEATGSLQLMPMTKHLRIRYDVDEDESETDIFDDEGNYIDSIWTSLSTRLTEREFILLLLHFPNLECLDFEQSVHTFHYKRILIGYQGKGHLPAVKDFNMRIAAGLSGDTVARKLEYALYHRFRHSLKVMTITYVKDLVEGSHFLKVLPDFTHLRSLDFYNDTDPNLTLFHLLRACPNVTSLTYNSPLPTSREATKKLARVLGNSKEELSLLKNLQKLANFKLILPTITTPYIDFLANHTPQSLTSIELLTTETHLSTWIDSVSIDVAIKFCKSLQKFSSIKMKFVNYYGGRAIVAESSPAMHSEYSQIDVFYLILDALTTGRDLCSNHTAIYSSDSFAIENFEITNGVGVMYQYHLPKETGTHDRYQECAPPVPSSSLSLKQIAQIKKITFKTSTRDIVHLPVNSLNFVKRYCPELKHFELQPQIRGCSLQLVCRDPLRLSLENTTHVYMEGANFSQALSDSVNEYFPHVQSLSFGNSTSWFTPVANLEFELSEFKHLDTFIIDIEKCPVDAGDLIFIEFRYTGSKNKMQYQVKKVSTVTGRSGNTLEFQPVSTFPPQDKLGAVEKRTTCIIYIEGPPQLASIQVKDPDSATSTLDLLHL